MCFAISAHQHPSKLISPGPISLPRTCQIVWLVCTGHGHEPAGPLTPFNPYEISHRGPVCRGRNSRRNSIGKIEFAFVSVSHTCDSLNATRKLHLWVVMKRKLLGIAAIAALIGTPALAADMPVKAPPAPASSWTGFYVGGEAGYGWEDQAVNQVPNDPAAAMLFSGAIGFAAEQPIPGSYKVDRTGAVGGFEAGYNWQSGSNWVWGLETDFNFSGINGQASGTSVIQGPPAATFLQTTTSQQNTDWYGTVRGRFGYIATPTLLLFGTGGLAYGRGHRCSKSSSLPAPRGPWSG